MDYSFGTVYIFANIVNTTNPSHLMPYLKNSQIAYCPSLKSTVGYGWGHNHQPYRSGTPTPYAPVPISAYNYPAEQLLFMDSESYNWVYCPHLPNDNGNGYVGRRHNDGANVAFVDGHCKWLSLRALRSTEADGYRMWAHTN